MSSVKKFVRKRPGEFYSGILNRISEYGSSLNNVQVSSMNVIHVAVDTVEVDGNTVITIPSKQYYSAVLASFDTLGKMSDDEVAARIDTNPMYASIAKKAVLERLSKEFKKRVPANEIMPGIQLLTDGNFLVTGYLPRKSAKRSKVRQLRESLNIGGASAFIVPPSATAGVFDQRGDYLKVRLSQIRTSDLDLHHIMVIDATRSMKPAFEYMKTQLPNLIASPGVAVTALTVVLIGDYGQEYTVKVLNGSLSSVLSQFSAEEVIHGGRLEEAYGQAIKEATLIAKTKVAAGATVSMSFYIDSCPAESDPVNWISYLEELAQLAVPVSVFVFPTSMIIQKEVALFVEAILTITQGKSQVFSSIAEIAETLSTDFISTGHLIDFDDAVVAIARKRTRIGYVCKFFNIPMSRLLVPSLSGRVKAPGFYAGNDLYLMPSALPSSNLLQAMTAARDTEGYIDKGSRVVILREAAGTIKKSVMFVA